MINQRCIPNKEDAIVHKSTGSKYITTVGVSLSNKGIELDHMCLPQFSFTRRFGKIIFHAFHSLQCPCYDLILGRQILYMARMKLNFDSMETGWLGDKVCFHPRKYFRDNSKLCDLLCDDPL
jgi:hypothetical protein